MIDDYADDLAEAERVVNEMHFAWRRGEPVACQRQLDAMRGEWQSLVDDGDLVLRWPLPTARDRRTTPRSKRSRH